MGDKIGKTQIYNIRSMRDNIVRDSTDIKIRKYYEQFDADIFDK